jgi:hypothetical protein
MMTKKQFLTGMFSILLIFGLALAGCDNGTTDDEDDGGDLEPTAAELLAAALGDKVEVSGSTVTLKADIALTATDSLAIPAGVTLAVPSGKTLDLSAATATGAVTLNGSIEVSGTLKAPLPAANGTTPQIGYGDNGIIRINWGGAAIIGTNPYIGASASLYTWTDTTPGSAQYVTLKKNDEMFLHGNLTTANSITVKTKATIDTGATLTIGANDTDGRFFIDGDVQVSGTIKVEATSTSPQKGWVELRDTASKLTLNPGGKLDIPAASSIYTDSGTGESTPKVTVYDGTSPTKAAATGNATDGWTLTKANNAWGAIDITLGGLNLAIGADSGDADITGATAANPAAGTLTAGADTAIVFSKAAAQ